MDTATTRIEDRLSQQTCTHLFVLSLIAAVVLAGDKTASASPTDREKNSTERKTPQDQIPLEVQAPNHEPPHKYRLRYYNTSPAAPSGKLLYIGGSFVICSIGKAAALPKPVTSYPIKLKTAEAIFDPETSPNGRYILFRVGWPSDPPYGFKMYLLNLQTHQIQIGPPQTVTHRLAYWSPDSRFIAYIVGEDELFLYDVRANQSRRVIQDSGVVSLAWTRRGTLLVTLRDKGLPKPKNNGTGTAATTGQMMQRPVGPSIFEVPLTGGQPQLVIEAAEAPEPSPDGRWIVYFGLPAELPLLENAQSPAGGVAKSKADRDKQNEEQKAIYQLLQQQPSLCLYNRTENKRYLISQDVDRTRMEVQWTPDSKRLITMTTQLRRSSEGGKGENVTQIGSIDIDSATRKLELLTTLRGKEAVPVARPNAPQFGARQVTKDGRFLIIHTYELGELDPISGGIELISYWRAINLRDGNVLTLAALRTSSADWYDLSDSSDLPQGM